MRDEPVPSPLPLAWQSRTVLLLVLAPAGVYAALQLVDAPSYSSVLFALGISLLFTVLVLALRAATVGAAALGALLAFCLALTLSYPHSALWMLGVTLLLTLGASRIGRKRKQALAVARHAPAEHRSRDAAQVAANLGIAALAGTLVNSNGMVLAHVVLLAALAEATADTLASELGQLAGSPPRMLLTGRPAPPGTDGAISLAGTLAGIAGALAVGLVAHWAFDMPRWGVVLGCSAGILGLFADSLLGQLAERRGLLNNDAVNFLSTGAAALFALLVGRRFF